MSEKQFQVYGYRWVVIAVFMAVNLTIQILWIAYAPITGLAGQFYGVDDFRIGLLAMTFMIVFIPLSIPVSWVIDTYGFRIAVSIGAVLMGLFGIARGLAGGNYTLALLCTVGLGIAQPFMLNSWAKVAARWFSIEERATAIGLAIIANLIGIAIGMALTPILIETLTIPTVQLIYGGLAALSAVLFVILARENPPTPPCPEGMEVRALMLDGLKHALKSKQLWLYLVIFFVGMGLFNGLTTWVEAIIRPRGFTYTQAGTVGAVFLISGILGAAILPPISDRLHKRPIFLLIGLLGCLPGLVGITYATSYWLLLVSAFVMGFFLVSISPIGTQFAAEVTYPTPEGTSNGLVSLFGQASVVFVAIMDALKSPDGSLTPALLLSIGLVIASALISLLLKDAPMIQAAAAKEAADGR